MVVIGHKVSGGKSPNDPPLPIPDLSEPQPHGYGPISSPKILLERHVHLGKLGKSLPHPHEHEIFPLEINIITFKLNIDQVIQEFITRNL